MYRRLFCLPIIKAFDTQAPPPSPIYLHKVVGTTRSDKHGRVVLAPCKTLRIVYATVQRLSGNLCHKHHYPLREAAKKKSFHSDRATKRGGG